MRKKWTQKSIDSFMKNLVPPEEEARRDYSKVVYAEDRTPFHDGLAWALCMSREYDDNRLLEAFQTMYPEATKTFMPAAEKRYATAYVSRDETT